MLPQSLEPGGACIFSGVNALRKHLVQKIKEKMSERTETERIERTESEREKTKGKENSEAIATFLDRDLSVPIYIQVGKFEREYFINFRNDKLYGISDEHWVRFVSRWSTEKWVICQNKKWLPTSLCKISKYFNKNHNTNKWIACVIDNYFIKILINKDSTYFWFDSWSIRILSSDLSTLSSSNQPSAFVNASLLTILEMFEQVYIVPDYFHIGCVVSLNVNRHLGNSDLVKIICSYY